MVKIGQPAEVERRDFRLPDNSDLGIEIIRMAELRRRVKAGHLERIHRIEFHLLICVTHGVCKHWADFLPLPCRPGTMLMLRPSQVEKFDAASTWDGWLVLFRPEFLFSAMTAGKMDDVNVVKILHDLPNHLTLDRNERRQLILAMKQMREDTHLRISKSETEALLRHQLCAMLLRLNLVHRQQSAKTTVSQPDMERFNNFRQLLEQHFEKKHQVRDYAIALGCSEKSIARATQEVAGVSAKILIAERINLEAKRLLAHTVMPVASIGYRLGFDEPTNFIKFFKRGAGCTPREFRQQYLSTA